MAFRLPSLRYCDRRYHVKRRYGQRLQQYAPTVRKLPPGQRFEVGLPVEIDADRVNNEIELARQCF